MCKHMQLFICKSAASAAILAMLAAVSATPESANAALVARWGFNTGTSADLTSDVGGYTLSASGWSGTQANNYHTFNSDGTITLGAGRLLNTTSINSTAMPSLKTAMTIWVRMKFNGNIGSTVPSVGLINSALALPDVKLNGGSVSEQYLQSSATLLAASSGATPMIKAAGATASDVVYGRASNLNAVAVDQYFSTAITILDSGANFTYADRTNGVTVSGSAAGDMKNFASFGLGRLWQSGGNVITIDEVRIYDSVLSNAEIDALSATPVPEAASIGLLALGSTALLRRRR